MWDVVFTEPVTERVYKVIVERELKLYIFEPENFHLGRAAMLFFIGGSFKKGPNTPAKLEQQAKHFASKGIVSICVDYRNGHDEGFLPDQAICDTKSAVRWVRTHADELGVNPNKVIVYGTSAGGYLAVSAIILPGLDDDYLQGVNHVPDALVIYAAGMDGIDIMGRLFPQLSQDRAMELSPIHHIHSCLPKTLWMCGTADELLEQNRDFVNRMVQEGDDIQFVTYDGMEHGFFHYGRHDNKYFHETIGEIEKFLTANNLLEG